MNTKRRTKSSKRRDRVARSKQREVETRMRHQMLSSGFSGGFYNPTSSFQELVLKVTDYFDISGTYTQYVFGLDNGVFGPGHADDNPLARVLRARFYCLPKWSADPATSSLMVAFAVPVRNGLVESEAPVDLSLAFQQTTLLTPTSVADWVMVGDYDLSKMQNGNFISPIYDKTPPGSLGTRPSIPLGTLNLLDPATLANDPSTNKVLTRVEIEYATSVPLVYSIQGLVANVSSYAAEPTETELVDLSVVAQPLSVRNIQ